MKFAKALLAMLLTGSCTEAGTFFVSTTGNDSTGNGSLSSPWRTIAKGVAMIRSGDTLNIRGGLYDESVSSGWKSGTSWTSPTVIKAFEGEAVEIRPRNKPGWTVSGTFRFIIFEGLDFNGIELVDLAALFKITEGANRIRMVKCVLRNSRTRHGVLISQPGSDYNEFINCNVYSNGWNYASIGGSPPHGFYIKTEHNLVEGCTIWANKWGGGHGIHQYGGGRGNIYRNNFLYDNDRGIGLYSSPDAVVYNNVGVSNNVGIMLNYGTSSNRVFNNTLARNNYGVIVGGDALDGNWFANNLIISNRVFHGISINSGAGTTYWTNNLSFGHVSPYDPWYDGSGKALFSGNYFGSSYLLPFVNTLTNNYNLLAGNAARNAGRNLSGFFSSGTFEGVSISPTDVAGRPRGNEGAWDVGAYEYYDITANASPVISSFDDVTIVQGSPIPSIPFTVVDAETSPQNLQILATSSNQGLLLNSGIVVGGTGSDRTLSLSPLAGVLGNTTITISVSDGANTTSDSFVLTITPATAFNTAPQVSAGADASITLPDTLLLRGAVSDDGLPVPPGQVTTTWSVVSGPGTVTFSDPAQPETIAQFSLSGAYVLRLTANDGALSSSDDIAVSVTAAPTSGEVVAIPFEAEHGALTNPMEVYSSSFEYVGSTTNEVGTASYQINLPTAGEYTVWCRVLATAGDRDSFYVSVDDGAEIPYIVSESEFLPDWRWTRINQRDTSAATFTVMPRRFNLAAGTHTLRFRGREAHTYLDRLLITNDPSVVPLDTGGYVEMPRIQSITPSSGGMLVRWTSMPGKTYQIAFKNTLADADWSLVPGAYTSAGSSMYWFDSEAPTLSQRFYRIEVLP